jgi:hypothetical protein
MDSGRLVSLVVQMQGIGQCKAEPRHKCRENQSNNKNDQIRNYTTYGFFHGGFANRAISVQNNSDGRREMTQCPSR